MIDYKNLKIAVNNLEAKLSCIQHTAPLTYAFLENTNKIDYVYLSKLDAYLYYMDSCSSNKSLDTYLKFKKPDENNIEKQFNDFSAEQEVIRKKAELFLLPLRTNLAIIAAELNLEDIKDLCSKDDLSDNNIEKIECLIKELKKLY